MKALGFGILTALGVALTLTTTGCHPENLKDIPGRHLPVPEVPSLPAIPAPELPSNTNVIGNNIPLPEFPGHTNWIENRDALKEYSVHFLYDSSSVPSADKSKIAAVADYLKNHTDAAVRVEGNCDERGTEEYNRSLGERRALAAREALANAGVDASRVATRSYGEDRPADPGHTQSAWARNRRDEFVLLHPR
jgi:peptidoglycan-associated lipoprotein